MSSKSKCRKRRYRDHAHAVKALRNSARARYLSDVDELRATRRRETRAYECDDCGGWHLTSQPQRELGVHDSLRLMQAVGM